MEKNYKRDKKIDKKHDRQKFYLIHQHNNKVVVKKTKLENADNYIHYSKGAEKHNR